MTFWKNIIIDVNFVASSSHFNTSHFLNPEFQPEQWDPDDEYVSPPYPYGFAVGRRARNRSLRRFITMENFVAPRV